LGPLQAMRRDYISGHPIVMKDYFEIDATQFHQIDKANNERFNADVASGKVEL
tara:strand:- start:131 stop:289 length:159 start_codon:yes stop_codon:yes gene_type:complete